MEQKDSILHFTLSDGAVRGLIIRSTDTAREAQRVHGATAVAAAALGRVLTGTAMLAATLKEPDASVTLTVDGGGPLGKIICVGDGETVRGLVTDPAVRLPLRDGKLDVGRAVGHNGRLSVVKDLRMKTPYIGQVAMQSGEIAVDLADGFECGLALIGRKNRGSAESQAEEEGGCGDFHGQDSLVSDRVYIKIQNIMAVVS